MYKMYRLPGITARNGWYFPETDTVGDKLATGKEWEPEIGAAIKEHARGVCLDLGAHIGYFTIMMAKQADSVIAFEPNADCYVCLCANLLHRGIHNIRLANVAVYDSTGTLQVAPCNQQTIAIMNTASMCYANVEGNIAPYKDDLVRCVRVDEVVSKADFIKSDCQGSDLRALQGAQKLIESSKPRIVFEYELPLALVHGYRFNDIEAFFDNMNYKLISVRERSSIDKSGDYLAEPRS